MSNLRGAFGFLTCMCGFIEAMLLALQLSAMGTHYFKSFLMFTFPMMTLCVLTALFCLDYYYYYRAIDFAIDNGSNKKRIRNKRTKN